VLTLGGVFLWKHDQILDWAAARGYEPSREVSQLAADDTFTSYSDQLFRANRPELLGKADFNKHCTDPSDLVTVLGCFTGNRQGIYLYDVADPRLAGVEQVTAAHEMLHQAYQRLGGSEKTRVNGLLQQYHDLKASQKLKDKIASYKRSEPGELLNEMHSIFGTEAADIGPELEEYYKKYFSDRQKILAFYNHYQAEFDSLREQIEAYDAQLSALKTEIDQSKQELAALEAELRSDRSQLDAYLAANQIQKYNAAVPGFNAKVNKYRALISDINANVNEYNRILAERNALAVQQRGLQEAIDSSVDAAPKQQ
jgi:uncharacterized protein YukE